MDTNFPERFVRGTVAGKVTGSGVDGHPVECPFVGARGNLLTGFSPLQLACLDTFILSPTHSICQVLGFLRFSFFDDGFETHVFLLFGIRRPYGHYPFRSLTQRQEYGKQGLLYDESVKKYTPLKRAYRLASFRFQSSARLYRPSTRDGAID